MTAAGQPYPRTWTRPVIIILCAVWFYNHHDPRFWRKPTLEEEAIESFSSSPQRLDQPGAAPPPQPGEPAATAPESSPTGGPPPTPAAPKPPARARATLVPPAAAAPTPISRPQLARLVRLRGYHGLTNAQKAACTEIYLTDLRGLHAIVSNRLLSLRAAIPNFQRRPEYAQINRLLGRLAQAIADLERHGTATDCTRYQPLIDEVLLALQGR